MANAARPLAKTAADDDRRLRELVDRWNAAQRVFNDALAGEHAAGERLARGERVPGLDRAPGERWIFAVRRRIAAGKRVSALRGAIVDAPASTPLGLLLKLGVAIDGFDDATIVDSLARERSPDGASNGAILLSAMRDFRRVFPVHAALA